MKKLFLLVGCLLALSSMPALAQAKSDVVVVRLLEREHSIRMMIARGDAPVESVEIENGGGDNDLSASAEGLQKVLAKLYAEGYVTQSTLSSGSLAGFSTKGGQINTIILARPMKP